MRTNPLNAYNQGRYANIHGAHPVEITIMMLDRTIEHIKFAKYCIENKGDPSAYASAMTKSVALVTEGLMPAVDPTNKLADDLYQLYDYVNRRLIEANIKKDTSILEECQNLLTTMSDTWKEAMKLATQSSNKVAAL